MKIKDRLIHSLGGYTKEEYDKKISTNPACKYASNTAPIRTLKAGYVINDSFREPPENWLKNELTARLANKMLEDKLVTFYTATRNTGPVQYPYDVYAMVKIVEPSDVWGMKEYG